jgi:hypothetical protein
VLPVIVDDDAAGVEEKWLKLCLFTILAEFFAKKKCRS